MNLGQLEADFRIRTQDSALPYLWPHTEVAEWFNEAEREACIRGRLIFDKTSGFTTIAIAADSDTTIDLDPSIIEIQYARLITSGGVSTKISPSDRTEQDRLDPDWRDNTDLPSAFIHDDKSIELNAIPEEAYTLKLETYRLPTQDMSAEDDEPEISSVHHRHLVHWVLHRAYLKPDADGFDPGKAEKALAEFEAYFGPRPDAANQRRTNANRPHRNKPSF